MKYLPDTTLSSQTSIADALAKFSASSLRGLPVVDKGKLVGVLSQSDLSRIIHMESKTEHLLVRDLMTSHPVAVNPYDSLEEILFLFTRYKFTWLPVAEEERFIGIISQSDVAASLFAAEPAPLMQKLESDKSEVSLKD
jgi:CIC family chloride channel protein